MKFWVMSFRVTPPVGVVSARVGSNIFFAAYSKLLKTWIMVYPGGEQIIPEPDMIFVESEWADAHKRDIVPARLPIPRRGRRKSVQLELFS